MSVSCECCVLSGRGHCDELITRPEESYRLRCVVVCDPETSWMRRPGPNGGCCARNKQTLQEYKSWSKQSEKFSLSCRYFHLCWPNILLTNL